MKLCVLLAATAAAFVFGGACASDDSSTTTETDTSSSDTPTTDSGSDTGGANPCAFPLITLQTSSDDTCSGGNRHMWPVGMAATDCHGWTALDNTGGLHENSAADIKCNPDGSFSLTQYAGNLDCSGTGVTKTYALNSCEEDNPPPLHTMAIDLTCCTDPTSASCNTGVPSATQADTEIYLNNVKCSP
ncbi:MAG: hypothetical protein ACI9MR_002402 [Myxococcota bacterium]|jgi:hypothetical protein